MYWFRRRSRRNPDYRSNFTFSILYTDLSMPTRRNISRNSLYGIADGVDRLFIPSNDQLRDLLLQLVRFVKEKSQRAIIIKGSPGVGAAFIRNFLNIRPPGTDVEWYPVGKSEDSFETIRGLLRSLRGYAEKHDHEILIILDEIESLPSGELERIVGLIFNWKRIKHVIVITSNFDLHLRRARNIVVDSPRILYELQDQVVVPVQAIIPVVGPQIIEVNDTLIQRLKKSPDDLRKISPRQFEEVIADLLIGLGMDVELTPATRDGGKDILAFMNTELGRFITLVEAKQHNKSRPVGVGLVSSLFGTLVDHQATSGMLVTTSRFAKPAKQFQERHKYQLTLKEYKDVVKWLLHYKGK